MALKRKCAFTWQAVDKVLTEVRVNAKQPLRAAEFIPVLATLDPVFKEEEEIFKVAI